MTLAVALFSFTVGLVLHPVIAKAVRHLTERRRATKERRAIVLLQTKGYTVNWPPTVVEDTWSSTTQENDLSAWGMVDTGIGSTATFAARNAR